MVKYNVYFPSELRMFRDIPNVQGDELADDRLRPSFCKVRRDSNYFLSLSPSCIPHLRPGGGGGGADNVPKAILEAGRHGCSWSWGRCQRGGPELDRGHWKSWLKHVGKRRTQGPRGGTAVAAAASEVRWQSCGCVGRRTAWQG